jgi:hypothetical protein
MGDRWDEVSTCKYYEKVFSFDDPAGPIVGFFLANMPEA